MTTVTRAGVQFDMCPICRGVWLDRGELEKLMAATAEDAPDAGRQTGAAPPQQQPPPPRWDRRYGGRGEYGERGEQGYGGYRKKRSILDIFD